MVFIATIFVTFPGSSGTIGFSQTHFILLFFLLLTIKNVDNSKAVIFLAVSAIVKPFVIVFIVFFLITKRWNIVAAFLLTGVAIIAATTIIFGYEVFISYLLSPPTLRIPEFAYYEGINQSLFAVLIRLFGVDYYLDNTIFVKGSFYTIGILIFISTCFLSIKLNKINKSLAFLVFIPTTLLIYPGSLSHYSVYLIPIILEISLTTLLFKKTLPVSLSLVLVYVLGNYSSFLLNVSVLSFFILAYRLKFFENLYNKLNI